MDGSRASFLFTTRSAFVSKKRRKKNSILADAGMFVREMRLMKSHLLFYCTLLCGRLGPLSSPLSLLTAGLYTASIMLQWKLVWKLICSQWWLCFGLALRLVRSTRVPKPPLITILRSFLIRQQLTSHSASVFPGITYFRPGGKTKITHWPLVAFSTQTTSMKQNCNGTPQNTNKAIDASEKPCGGFILKRLFITL